MKFHFLCTTNPTGPLLVLDSDVEAHEMKTHPDYILVDADRKPIDWPNTVRTASMPFSTQPRPKLGLPKKK